jgi:hypothetical protein
MRASCFGSRSATCEVLLKASSRETVILKIRGILWLPVGGHASEGVEVGIAIDI